MDPQVALAAILVLCLALILLTYVLGVEVGKASTLRRHPHYDAARVTP
jgi:ABC-type antimicrobial peptide transport system permease subunit